MIWPGKLTAFLFLLFTSAPAAAQEACRIPDTLQSAPCGRREASHDRERRGQPGDFDFYLLALSWSPSFCASEAGRGKTGQCRDNSFGWVVHGLWPQYAKARGAKAGKGREPWPQYCAPVQALPSALLRRNFCTMPDQQLMQCQWAKHGSCSGLAPEAYFDAIENLRRRFTLPPLGDATMASNRLRALVLEQNPGLKPGNLQVVRRDGRLRELRICLDRTLRNAVDCSG